MSEFLGEARVLIRPDTTKFRAELQAQVLVAAKGVTVPVTVVPTAAGGTAGLLAQTAAINSANAASQQAAGITKAKADADRIAEKAAAAHARQLGQVQTAALASAASMTGLRGAVLTAGAAFIGATIAIQTFARSIQLAAALETELNVFRVTAGATADEMKRVREEAVALGRDLTLPSVSAGDAAQAINLLARAGLSVEDSLSGARGVLQLATAAQIENAEATQLTASALNAFGLAGEDAVHVADLLANSANLSQGEITDMGIALRQSAGAAAQVGLTLDETVAILTSLARSGLAGSDAGTTLRVALLRLVAPTKNARKELEALNINLRDAAGNVRAEALFELEEALQGVSKAQADVTRKTIFGENAFRVSALLGRVGAAGFRELAESVSQEGAAAELAAARTAGFAGKVEALKSNLETLGTVLGEAVIGPLGDTATVLADVASGFAEAAEEAKKFAASLPGQGGGDGGDPFGIFSDLQGQVEEINDFFKLITQGENLKFGELPSEGLARVRKEADLLTASLATAELTAGTLQQQFRQGGGIGSPTAVNEFVLKLDALADRLAKGDAAAQKLATRVRALIKELQTPTSFKVGLDIDFNQSDLDSAGRKAGEQTAQGALASLRAAGSAVGVVGLQWIDALKNATVPAAAEAGSDTGDAFVKGFNDAQIRGQLQAQKTAVAQAQAFGETGLEELIKERDRIDRILNSAKAPSGPALEALFNERASVVTRINNILQEQAADQKGAAQDIQRAQSEADQALLETLGNRRDDAGRRIASAAATEGVADDIRRQDQLQALIKQQIQKVRDRISDEKTRKAAIRELRLAIIESRAEEEKLRQEQKQNAINTRVAGIELDIELADINENEARQVALRKRLIAQLRKKAKDLHLTGNALKENRNEIARINKEIEDIQKEQKKGSADKGQSAQQFFFEQLQAQQGFASNLLGNLIPAGLTSGLVGVPSDNLAGGPGASISLAAGVQEGKGRGGPTSGQASESNVLLRQILSQLKALNGRNSAPEATRQRVKGAAIMDGGGGNVEAM